MFGHVLLGVVLARCGRRVTSDLFSAMFFEGAAAGNGSRVSCVSLCLDTCHMFKGEVSERCAICLLTQGGRAAKEVHRVSTILPLTCVSQR